ncbi:MAG: hypothetical protein GX230_11570 [Lentisphaerae bacterium]|jgi:hypothetical protein|nr:hypothetical protein [Lentisphaerota bacterium]
MPATPHKNHPAELPEYTTLRAIRFYIPLAIQSVSQSFTYPLVATVVSHGICGVAGYGAFAQGLAVFMLISALSSGLLSTGMVYSRSLTGFNNHRRLNLLVMVVIVVTQLLCSIPPLDNIIFGHLLGLEGEMWRIARDTLLYCIPVHIMFLLRSPYQIIFYNARASAVANAATLGRIGATLVIAFLFVKLGFVGHYAGIVAFSLPVVGEWYASRRLSRPYIQNLADGEPDTAPVREQLLFCIPLSFGGILLSLSAFMVAAFIARAADPIHMMPIHYVAFGLINPLAFAAIRMQAVVLAFPPIDRSGSRTFRFSLGVGATLAAIALLGQIPSVANVYFGKIQNLSPADILLAQRVMLIASIIPVFQALRGHAEGLAAWRKRPNAILAGQATYLATLVTTLFFSLNAGVPGYMMGAYAIIAAIIATFVTIRIGVAWSDFEDRTPQFTPHRTEDTRL